MAGVSVIENIVKNAPATAGVYRMLDENGNVLYVGKARNLKARLTSYTRLDALERRIAIMISKTAHVELISTASEHEALLLEADLIRRLKPKYNIIFRDDKSYPYIFLSDEEFPKLMKHRGAKKQKGEYFGPFANVLAVNETIEFFQRAFLIRTCSDANFSHRTRPCLLYHIKRCSAPCVGKISQAEYAKNITVVRDFMRGKKGDVLKILQTQMNEAAQNQNYEKAAELRDKIASLTGLTGTALATDERRNIDVVAAVAEGNLIAIQMLMFRNGFPAGSAAHFVSAQANDMNLADALSTFITQFYAANFVPDEIIASADFDDREFTAEALGTKITVPQMGAKKELVNRALQNAKLAAERYAAEAASELELFTRLRDLLKLPGTPERIDVFDNSHLQGTNAVAAMIVASPSGFRKNLYRKFNMDDGGDDLTMMREVLTRRYKRGVAENTVPDLIILDGGQTQLAVGKEVMAELALDIPLIAISKGVDRNAGNEQIHLTDGKVIKLAHEDKLLFLFQRMRDEAHRFVINTHRKKRSKSMIRSELSEISGLGPKKKKALLEYFGVISAIKNASVAELSKVSGIDTKLATSIYDFFHHS